MLTDYEREQCRNYKKMMDMAQTPQGQIAARLAEEKRRETERLENILKRYTEPPAPPVKSQPETNPILKLYIDD
jgi:hypothetical protein